MEFLAVAWKSDMGTTRERAKELLSNITQWGLDEDVFALYGIPAQPASVIVVNGVIVDSWFGAGSEEDLRARFDAAIALA